MTAFDGGRLTPLELDPAGEALRTKARRLFSPDPVAAVEVEVEVVAAFRAAASDGAPAVSRGPLPVTHRRSRARWLRVAAAVVVAATLGLGGGGAAIVRAGAPLYGVRLAVERALLPGVSAASRVDGQLQLLDDRLTEAAEAASRRDATAARAALAAYRDDLGALTGIVALHPERQPDAVVRLARQEAALDRLAHDESAGPTARAALDDAAAVRSHIAPARRPSRALRATPAVRGPFQ
jgi:hypothetical protein